MGLFEGRPISFAFCNYYYNPWHKKLDNVDNQRFPNDNLPNMNIPFINVIPDQTNVAPIYNQDGIPINIHPRNTELRLKHFLNGPLPFKTGLLKAIYIHIIINNS